PPTPGTFVVGPKGVIFAPRPIPQAAQEPLVVSFDKNGVKEIRGLKSRRRYLEQTLEPELITYLFDETREKRRRITYEEPPDHLSQAGSFSINGVGEAARMYFHKDVSNLSLPETALLAGMIQSPNPYNPYRHPERATERRNLVIRAMNEAGFIDQSTMEKSQS